MHPIILVRFGYGYIVVQIGREVICILIFPLALFYPIFAAHLQDDKCGLAFTRFLELCPSGGKKSRKGGRPGGKKSRKGGKAGGTFTLEEAEATAKADGLVLVRSRKNPSGYKGVLYDITTANYKAEVWEEGTIKTIGRYATRFEAALEYARRIGPDKSKMEATAYDTAVEATNFTLEDAEAAAKAEGLVLLPSTNFSGYKGVTKSGGKYSVRGPRKGAGKGTFIGDFATRFEAALEYSRMLAKGRVGGAKATPVARLTAQQMSREGRRGASAEGEGGTEANKGESSGESDAGGNDKKLKAKIKLTPKHLYVAYVRYLEQREARGEGLVPGEEESVCLECKDGGDVLLCDYLGCTKSYHPACANLKIIPEGIWECPRHRCMQCGSGPSRTDMHGRPRRADPPGEAGCTLWACRTCPITYCQRCLPKEITLAGVKTVCERCQELLSSADMALLQQDLIQWKPELFSNDASADV